MALTLTGTPVQFVRRPQRLQPVRRLGVPQTPLAWLVLAGELLSLPKSLALESWQALRACPFSEVRSLCYGVLGWPECPETWPAVAARGVSPARVLHALELCVLSATLTPHDAALIEEAILAQVDRTGEWQRHTVPAGCATVIATGSRTT